MSTHERLLDVAKRLDELAGELESDELVTLSNELAEIADIGGADKAPVRNQEPPRTELERRLNDLLEWEIRRRISEDPRIVERVMYEQRRMDAMDAMRYVAAPVLNPADFRKITTP